MRSPIRSLTPLLAVCAACSWSAAALGQADAAMKVEAKPPAAEKAPAPAAAATAPAVPAAAPAPAVPAPAAPAPAAAAPATAPAAKPAAAAPAPAAPSTAVPAAEKKASKNNPKAVEIVSRYLDAIGGSKTFEAIVDRMQKFRNTKHAAAGDTVAVLNQYIKKGYKVREEWDIEKVEIKGNPLSFTQVYNGSEGWVQMFGTVSALEGRTLSLFVWDKFLDDAFAHWEEDGNSVEYVGPGTVDAEPCEIVEMSDFTGSKKERYFFSKSSGLLLKKEWKEQGQNTAGLAKKEIAFKKYKPIPFSDGSGKALQMALLHEVYEEGDLDTTREFTEIKINSGLKDAIFERPEGVEFKPSMIGQGFPNEKKEAPKQAPPAGGHPSVTPPHPPVTPPAGAPAPKAEAK